MEHQMVYYGRLGKKVDILWNKNSSTGCKWSSLNVSGSYNPWLRWLLRFAEGAHLSFISERCLAPRRAAMLFVDAERMGISQLKSHRNDTKRLLTLGHSNWTICSLLNWFCSNNFSIFSPASHNKLILYPAEREKEGSNRGRKWGKGNPQKLMTPRGFWPWDIQTGLFAAYQTDFVPKNVRLFPQPPIINQFFILQREEGGKQQGQKMWRGNSSIFNAFPSSLDSVTAKSVAASPNLT